jgi:GNAT superfamily N-acetyltransferase
MSGVTVKPVTTRHEKKLFLNFPWVLYRGDPNWVPPLRMDQKELVGYAHHPFFEKNQAQTFLAFRDGRVCGRIAAILNRVHIEKFNDPRGFFGFFECEDDQEAADLLLAAVKDWFEQQGITRVRGPMNPGLNYTIGLLVEGFDSPPTFMMTYNPPYYARLLESCGFHKVHDLYAYYGHKGMLSLPGNAKRAKISEQIVERLNIKLKSLDRTRFLEDVESFLNIYNCSMYQHWGFTPMSDAEVKHTAKSLRWLMVPELAMVAEIDGKRIGAVFCLPDYNPRIKKINGRLFPFGFLRLIWNKKAIKKVRVLSTNVLPEYHLMGIGLVLLRGLMPKALAWGLEEVEYSWVSETNAASRGSLEKAGSKLIKTYRLYDWEAEAAG